MLGGLEKIVSSLNSSKYFSGVMMLLLNIGGKQISKELSLFHENVLNHKVIRRFFVFVAVFVATKDIKISLIVTVVFIILVTGLLHEESNYCLIPKSKIGNNRITKNEYLMAQQIVNKYEKQK